MANKLDPMDLKQIIMLHLDGTSNRRIGSILGISRNTVNTYMQLFTASEYSLEELLNFESAKLFELFSSHITVDTDTNPFFEALEFNSTLKVAMVGIFYRNKYRNIVQTCADNEDKKLLYDL